jgi:serine/threonine-protein kinase RsbW
MPSMPDAAPPGCSARAVIHSDALSVRGGLATLFAAPPLCDLPQDARGTAELVLGEVLNNIVEHAYATNTGPIEVCVTLRNGSLACQIADHGAAMPGGAVPPGQLPAGLAGGIDDLPEGGFGWFLIRTLTADLTYHRQDGRNHLGFTLPLGDQATETG